MSAFQVNQHSEAILGAVVKQAITHGRMVKLAANSTSYDFGGRDDLPGCLMPTSAAEAALSHYVCLFADDNRSLPVYDPGGSYTFALRQGFDQTGNSPLTSQTVYPVHPKDYETAQVIPSGSTCRLYGAGVFTVPSGGFVYAAALEVPGATMTVNATAGGDDQGKLTSSASNVVAEVVKFNTDASLTFRITP